MRIRKAVIPAAGFGTRMLPATKTLPKEMLPIAGKPAIQYIVEEAVNAGITDIMIITGRGKTVLEDYFDYAPELTDHLISKNREEESRMLNKLADMANIIYLRQKSARGLGHAVWCAKEFICSEPFAVLLPDDIMMSNTPVTAQLCSRFDEYQKSVVAVKSVSADQIGRYCSLKVEKESDNLYKVFDLIEKPRPEQVFSNLAILGRYVLTPDIFEILGNLKPGFGNEIQLTDALSMLCSLSGLYALEFEGRRFDAGNPCGYLETMLEFSLKSDDTSNWLKNYIKQKARELE